MLVIRQGETLQLSCTPTQGSFPIHWSHNGFSIPPRLNRKRNALSATLSPPGVYTNLTIHSASPGDSGTYTCSIRISEMVAVARNITVTVIGK